MTTKRRETEKKSEGCLPLKEQNKGDVENKKINGDGLPLCIIFLIVNL